MMVRSLLLAVSCALLPFSTVTPDKKFDYQSQVGMIELSPDGQGCLTIKEGSLKDGTPVNVILLGSPQARDTAVIEKKLAKACPRDIERDAADSSYQLKLPQKMAESGSVALGVVGFSGEFELRDGLLRAELGGVGIKDSFRECTSVEGLHLTVWNGEPLRGSRKWHRYFYLGYDVEPNCRQKDY
jgi:hypothetical protein